MSSHQDITYDALRSYGLSDGEVRTLMALMELGQKEPKDIASKAEVKQPKVYGYLNSLVEKEMVAKIEIEGKPNRYEALIDSVINQIDSYIEQTQSNFSIAKSHLEKMKSRQLERVPDFIRIFQGERAVESGMSEILNEAKNSITIFVNDEFRSRVSKIIHEIENSKPHIQISQFHTTQMFENLKRVAGDNLNRFPQSVKTLLASPVLPMILFIDPVLDELSAGSANFILPSIDEMDPIIFHFKHPVIIRFQLMVFNLISSNFFKKLN